jgi:hypothetical protein
LEIDRYLGIFEDLIIYQGDADSASVPKAYANKLTKLRKASLPLCEKGLARLRLLLKNMADAAHLLARLPESQVGESRSSLYRTLSQSESLAGTGLERSFLESEISEARSRRSEEKKHPGKSPAKRLRKSA